MHFSDKSEWRKILNITMFKRIKFSYYQVRACNVWKKTKLNIFFYLYILFSGEKIIK